MSVTSSHIGQYAQTGHSGAFGTTRLFFFYFAICLLVVLASVTQDIAVAAGVLADKIWLLDVDVEQSIPTWLSVVALAAAALLFFLNGEAAAERGSALRWHWYILALIFLLLSADEALSIHEKFSAIVKDRFGGGGLTYFAWALPAGILAVIGFIGFLPFLRSLPRRYAIMLGIAAVMYLSGAVVAEMFGGAEAEAAGLETLQYRLLSNFEEALELGGLLLAIYALLGLKSLTDRGRAAG